MTVRVLNSWKEIATYMGRGVRTVQRWERELDLPVRRPRGKSRSAVIALADDLDGWLQRTPQSETQHQTLSPRNGTAVHHGNGNGNGGAGNGRDGDPLLRRRYTPQQLAALRDRLHSSTRVLIDRTAMLRENLTQTYKLCEDMTVRQRQRDDRARAATSNK
jgi:hypothetical protein